MFGAEVRDDSSSIGSEERRFDTVTIISCSPAESLRTFTADGARKPSSWPFVGLIREIGRAASKYGENILANVLKRLIFLLGVRIDFDRQGAGEYFFQRSDLLGENRRKL